MNRRGFVDSLPTDNGQDKEAAELLGIKKAALSIWLGRKSSKPELALLEGWALLTPEQRAQAVEAAKSKR